jgi:hypothetical protein
MAYINGFHYAQENGGIRGYIAGNNNIVLNNESPEWGPVVGVDQVIHKYAPQLAYINQVVTAVSSSKNVSIVNYGIIMELLTRDGRIDPETRILDDSSSINNDGIITGRPQWIVGPHG